MDENCQMSRWMEKSESTVYNYKIKNVKQRKWIYIIISITYMVYSLVQNKMLFLVFCLNMTYHIFRLLKKTFLNIFLWFKFCNFIYLLMFNLKFEMLIWQFYAFLKFAVFLIIHLSSSARTSLSVIRLLINFGAQTNSTNSTSLNIERE